MLKKSFPIPELSVDLVRAGRLSKSGLAKLDDDSLRQLEIGYRKFLLLKSKYPKNVLAPTGLIDEMWHLHMLHPCAYVEDCMSILGFVLDHNPGFGSEPGTMPILLEHFSETRALWEKEFGEPYAMLNAPTDGVVMCADKPEGKPEPKPRPKPKVSSYIFDSGVVSDTLHNGVVMCEDKPESRPEPKPRPKPRPKIGYTPEVAG